MTLLYRYSETMGVSAADQSSMIGAAGQAGLFELADLSNYADTSQISGWALNAMRWAVGVGIVTGRSSKTLAPQGEMTRGEVAQVLMNIN